jgi:hypothetical protein
LVIAFNVYRLGGSEAVGRKADEAAYERRAVTLGARHVDADIRVERQQLLEGDPACRRARWLPMQKCGPLLKARCRGDVSAHVELVGGIAELAWVPVGRAVEHHHLFPRRDGGASDRDVLNRRPAQPLHG